MPRIKSFLQKIGILKENTPALELERCPPDVFINYETLCLKQPQLNIKGIWKEGYRYYIVCPGLRKDAVALSGELFEDWFTKNKVIGGNSTVVTAYIPPNSKKVRILTGNEIADMAATVRNLTFFYYDLLLALPKQFPEFKLKNENGSVTIYANSLFTKVESEQFDAAVKTLNITFEMNYEVIDLATYQQPLLNTALLLMPSKIMTKESPAIRQMWEEDEDFWLTNKYKLLNQKTNKDEFFDSGFVAAKSGCVITDSNKPGNIRSYLSLYETTYLRLPILEFQHNFFKDLRCSAKELKELCRIGRVKLIADQPLHRYENTVLDLLSEINKGDYVLSRKLAAANVIDLRARLPFIFPVIDIETKHEILHLVYGYLKNHKDGGELSKLFECIALMWGDYFEGIQRMGSYGLLNFGIHHLLDMMFRKSNKDFGVELMDAEPGVNYAAAIGAHCVASNSYNNEPFMSLMANFYSGIPRNFIIGNQILANTAVENILVINNDVPVVDFATSFRSGDINRFHKFIYGLTKHIKDENELSVSIENFNKEIRHFVKDQKGVAAADVRGFVVDSATAASGTSIPVAGWFIERMMKMLNLVGSRNSSARKIKDYLEAYISDSKPDAVLVARMRNQLVHAYTKDKFGYK